MHIIIDGYNLIRQSDVLRLHERQGLEAGRKALVHLLAGYRRTRGHRITVVFDGASQTTHPGNPTTKGGTIRVIFSRSGQKADQVIQWMVRELGEGTIVVTSDRELQAEVERRHGTVLSSEEFELKMELAIYGDQKGIDPKDLIDAKTTRKKGPSKRPPKKVRKMKSRIEKL